MNILDKIVQYKRGEVISKMNQTSLQDLQESSYYSRRCLSMKTTIRNGSGIIAEFKRKSPSKGLINFDASPREIAIQYENAGVSAISILTDEEFFGGTKSDFDTVRESVNLPLLRKDFIIDSYQIHESKSMGADVILLIARILTPDLTREFTELAHALGMEVLLETHSKKEIQEHYFEGIDLVGINNRDLNSFEVSIQNSIDLAQFLPENCIKIAESGIHSEEVIHNLKNNGFQGFLMGEFFMKTENPGKTCQAFIQNLNLVSYEN